MSLPGEARAYAPASVANVACGFDVLGLALEAPGDTVVARRCSTAGVRLLTISGDDGRLPTEPTHNTAGVAAAAVLQAAGAAGGVELELHKGLPLRSGLGSSAASAVAAAVAVNHLLGAPLDQAGLLDCALEGEGAATGSRHADNAAASLHGGLILVRGARSPEVISLPVPAGLAVAVVRPHLEVDTGAARRLLGDQVPLAAAVAQWGNLAGLVVALFREDLELLGRCLKDVIAEPSRQALVPGFDAARRAALTAGALGASLSGSGPAVFALAPHMDAASAAGKAMQAIFASAAGLQSDLHLSRVGAAGARLLSGGTGCAT